MFLLLVFFFFFFSSRRRHTRFDCDWSSDVCSSDLVKVVDLTEGSYTERELMMVKVRAVGKEREEMKRMADIFRGRIIDVTEKSYTVELTGDQSKNDAFLQALDRTAILETVRTGSCGIGRGERILRV